VDTVLGSEFDREAPAEDKRELVGRRVAVPLERALQPGELDLLPIELRDHTWARKYLPPVVGSSEGLCGV
jgi:hypothetical protein